MWLWLVVLDISTEILDALGEEDWWWRVIRIAFIVVVLSIIIATIIWFV